MPLSIPLALSIKYSRNNFSPLARAQHLRNLLMTRASFLGTLVLINAININNYSTKELSEDSLILSCNN